MRAKASSQPKIGGASVGDVMAMLEAAITAGNHREAAVLAKEVSKMKISQKLSQQEVKGQQQPETIKKQKPTTTAAAEPMITAAATATKEKPAKTKLQTQQPQQQQPKPKKLK